MARKHTRRNVARAAFIGVLAAMYAPTWLIPVNATNRIVPLWTTHHTTVGRLIAAIVVAAVVLGCGLAMIVSGLVWLYEQGWGDD